MMLLLHACGSVPVDAQAVKSEALNTARTYVFTCDDGPGFVVRIEDETAWLFLPAGTLSVQKDATGTYRNEEVALQLNDQDALLEFSGGKSLNCSNNRRQAIWEHAKLNGADFRAIGNEPGWNLEIRSQSKIILVTDYGADRYEFDLPESETDMVARTTHYEVVQDGQTMTLTISGESCRDSMSGEEFESKVEIVLKRKTLRGCGRALH